MDVMQHFWFGNINEKGYAAFFAIGFDDAFGNRYVLEKII